VNRDYGSKLQTSTGYKWMRVSRMTITADQLRSGSLDKENLIQVLEPCGDLPKRSERMRQGVDANIVAFEGFDEAL